MTDTGMDVEGYNCSISTYEIIKILKNSHGNDVAEGLRGQRAITTADILDIPTIITSPNTVQTMFSGKKRSLATPPDGARPRPQTSKTSSGTASTPTLPQDQGESKTKFSLKSDGEGYDTSGVHWAIRNGILDKKDQAVFWETLANINKLGYACPKTYEGEYIIDTGDKLLFTDGDFKAPSLSRVIVFAGQYESNLDEWKGWIYDEEAKARDRTRNRKPNRIIEILQDKGYVSEHLSGAYPTHGGQDGAGEGADGGGDSGPARQREWRFSQKDNGTVTQEMASLVEENVILRARVEYWRDQTRRTARVTTDKNAVKKTAQALVKTYGSQVDKGEVASQLQSLYDYVASGKDGGDELVYAEARRRAERVGRFSAKDKPLANTENSVFARGFLLF